ncbi:MAG TPA: transposase [Steroidobacteraceae bacterium]|nr:transposase [Steroidobacteraceae bacterium]
MPRRPRLHVPGGFYHVTQRGNHRRRIFFRKGDYELLDGFVAASIAKCHARLHAYCWMPNHLHLLVQISCVELGNVMRRITSRYARAVQARVPTTGHLFERRYHSLLVDSDAYLLELLRYIHLNPVRSGLVGHPDDYSWSSHAVYVGRRTAPWVTTDFGLSMFHQNRGRATDLYRRFIDERVGQHYGSPLRHVNARDPRILGDDDFAIRAIDNSWRPRSPRSLDDLIDDACARYSIERERVLSPATQRRLTRARAWIAQEALRGRVASLAAVARALGRSESALRECVSRHFPDASQDEARENREVAPPGIANAD